MLRASAIADNGPTPYDIIVLAHDERHLRRKVLTTVHDEAVMVDLPAAVRLKPGQRLVLDDGRHIEIIEMDEPVYEITASDPASLARIAWHIGNRHARAQVQKTVWFDGNRPDDLAVLIARDHVLKDMLAGLGAHVVETSLPFEPEQPMLHGIPHHHAHD